LILVSALLDGYIFYEKSYFLPVSYISYVRFTRLQTNNEIKKQRTQDGDGVAIHGNTVCSMATAMRSCGNPPNGLSNLNLF
jgi:hypothetical protein